MYTLINPSVSTVTSGCQFYLLGSLRFDRSIVKSFCLFFFFVGGSQSRGSLGFWAFFASWFFSW